MRIVMENMVKRYYLFIYVYCLFIFYVLSIVLDTGELEVVDKIFVFMELYFRGGRKIINNLIESCIIYLVEINVMKKIKYV